MLLLMMMIFKPDVVFFPCGFIIGKFTRDSIASTPSDHKELYSVESKSVYSFMRLL